MPKLDPMFTRASRLALTLALAVTAAGCGSNDPGGGADGGATAQDPCPEGFLPLKTGTTWKYFVRDVSSQVATNKETVVEDLGVVPKVPGKMAYRVRTKKGVSLRDETVSWQNREGSAIVRYQESSFQPVAGMLTENLTEWWSPSKLRISENGDHLRKGATWNESYMETSIEAGVTTMRMRTDSWTVVGVNEEVTVPKGTYKALHLRRQGAQSSSAGDDGGGDKQYWFVCNVGKVKETGGQTEELTEYTAAP